MGYIKEDDHHEGKNTFTHQTRTILIDNCIWNMKQEDFCIHDRFKKRSEYRGSLFYLKTK